ncbi:hypothetical protein SDC9_66444 [bioreactor metagenome]|uniref:Protein translocase subunit SecDF n=1 Tax=bioreactor metagenome TaxID=1076179 RepID=A0A644XVU0_9ZZZZ
MQIKGTIRFFAVIFILVSIYSLSFSYCTRKVEKDAKEYATSEAAYQMAKELAQGDSIRERVIFDSVSAAWESYYLDSMSNEVIYNLLVKKFTYKECKEREINLGLDLKGGMNVTLEISEADIVMALSGNNPDANFRKAIKNASEMQKNSQDSYVNLFVQSIRELAPGKPLAADFMTRDLSDRIKTNSTDDEVISVLNEEISSAIDRTFMVLRKRIDKFGVTQPNIQKLNASGRILIELPGVKDPTRVRKILQGTAKLEFWETYDFVDIWPVLEKADQTVKMVLSKQESQKDSVATDSVKKDTTATAKVKPTTLEEQLDQMPGQTDSAVTDAGTQAANPLLSLFKQINVYQSEGKQYPGEGAWIGLVHSKDTAKFGRYLRMVSTTIPNTKFAWEAKAEKLENEPGDYFRLYALKITTTDGKPKLEGDNVADAWQDYDQNGRVEVSMMMTSAGAKIWKKMTADNVNHSIAIVLDNFVYSAPNVLNEIPNGRSSITGDFSVSEAQDLANVLKSGKLPAPARIVEEAVVGPSLGIEAINSGMISFIIAFVLVLIYMIFFYNKAGVAANIALVTNIVLIFGVLTSLGAVLTLPGIAGIVLTLGMAVDANVIIYERIKEELRAGKGVRLAVDDGYKAAYSAIIDGNVTTLLTGIVLFWFGSGPVQGFATTLIIGILTSLFTAIFISRLFFIRLLDRNKNITFDNKISRGFLTNTHFDFIGARKYAYLISGIVIAIGLFFIFTKGLNYGVDFSGGRTYVVRFDNDVKVDDVRSSLFKSMGETPDVKTFGSANQIKITTKYMVNDNSESVDSIVEAKVFEALKGFYTTDMTLQDFTSDNPDKVLGRLSSQKVGPTIADDIKQSSVYAIIVALLVIFIYIAIRFKKWYYGFGGVVALFHDSLIVVSLFSIFYGILPFNLEVDQTFIAAILTIIGYSINDTVIIFDRIREYGILYPSRSAKDNMNGAINSTLARTVNTAGSTIVVLLAIFILGGEIIRGFSFALLVGVLVGTYSSVFVASPLSYDLIKRKAKK